MQEPFTGTDSPNLRPGDYVVMTAEAPDGTQQPTDRRGIVLDVSGDRPVVLWLNTNMPDQCIFALSRLYSIVPAADTPPVTPAA